MAGTKKKAGLVPMPTRDAMPPMGPPGKGRLGVGTRVPGIQSGRKPMNPGAAGRAVAAKMGGMAGAKRAGMAVAMKVPRARRMKK